MHMYIYVCMYVHCMYVQCTCECKIPWNVQIYIQLTINSFLRQGSIYTICDFYEMIYYESIPLYIFLCSLFFKMFYNWGGQLIDFIYIHVCVRFIYGLYLFNEECKKMKVCILNCIYTDKCGTFIFCLLIWFIHSHEESFKRFTITCKEFHTHVQCTWQWSIII